VVAFVLDDKLRHERTVRLWRGDFQSEPPFDAGPDTLFVAYSAWAELACFLQLGWRFPKHIFDLHMCYLAATNVLLPYDPDDKRSRPRKRLSDACKAYGVEVGNASTRTSSRRTSARVDGASTEGGLPSLLRGGR
jgi:hypothetical protein